MERAERIVKEIWEMFCGQGLQVAGWHKNGDLEEIESFFRDNDWHISEEYDPQPSRPDRIGDECWFIKGDQWRKGFIRAWMPRDGAVIEDIESKRIWYAWEICFSTEAPT
jgi:hypothetical protein